jgi:hypothetical protein
MNQAAAPRRRGTRRHPERRAGGWGGFITAICYGALALAIIFLGVLWQRREAAWSARLRSCLPAALRELIEAHATG